MRIEEKSLFNDRDESLLSYLEKPSNPTKSITKNQYMFGRGKRDKSRVNGRSKSRPRKKSRLLNKKSKGGKVSKKKVRALVYADQTPTKVEKQRQVEDEDDEDFSDDIDLSRDFSLPKSTRRMDKSKGSSRILTPILLKNDDNSRTKKKPVKQLKRSKSSRRTFKKPKGGANSRGKSRIRERERKKKVADQKVKQQKAKKKVMKYRKPKPKSNSIAVPKNVEPKKRMSKSRSGILKNKNSRGTARGKKDSKMSRSYLGNMKSRTPRRKEKPKNEELDNSLDKDDLFSKLNELTKFNKEYDRVIQMSHSNSPISKKENIKPENGSRQETKVNKKQKKAEEFLKNKMSQMKRRKKKHVEIDYDRLLNPKYKKKASELKDECTFQPLLSKKSMDLAAKMGSAKKRLYNKKTPNNTKKPPIDDNLSSFRPKINQKSKFIDMKKGGYKHQRHERLNKLVRYHSSNR